MRHVSLPGKVACASLRTRVLALALCGASAVFACGDGGSGETSVLLVVKNGPGVPRPDQVRIEVYRNGTGVPEATLRPVASGDGDRLGDLVIYPSAGIARLRLDTFGILAGTAVSSAGKEVQVSPSEQITVELILQAPSPSNDAGVVADAGQPDGGPLPDAGATRLDARPQEDAALKKQPGQTCNEGNECQSGSCLEGVCCDRSCSGPCNTCKPANGPAGACTPLADGTECGDARCGPGNRTLQRSLCTAGSCERNDLQCKDRMCNATTSTCR